MAGYTKKISLQGKNSLEIYQAIAADLERFLGKSGMSNIQIDRNEAAKKVSFKASMASGTLTANEGELVVDLSLSLLATPFKGKIDEGIQKWVSKTFGVA
jgi:hypothetical protein